MSEATDHPEVKPRYKVDVILAYVKALAWPVLALMVFVVFWGPLHQIANLTPSLINRSTSIKIGSVTLVLGKDVTVDIPDRVRQALRSLGPDDLDDFLAAQAGTTFFAMSGSDQTVQTWRKWAS
jgi:hypothetical protein